MKHQRFDYRFWAGAALLAAGLALFAFAASPAAEVSPQERRVSLDARQMPLKDALATVCREAKVELELDREAFEFEGLTIDRPVTVLIQDEPLESAVAVILDRLPWDHFIFQSLRGTKLLVSGHRMVQERDRRNLPDWLKPLQGHGLLAKLDETSNVVSVYVGEKADDGLLAKLRSLPKLRELDMQTTKTITPAGLAQLAEFPALEKLHLYHVNRDGAGLGDAALRVAARIRTLRDLSIAECGVTDDGVRALAGMTQLTAVSLSGNQFTDAAMNSLAGLTNLQRLSLGQSSWVHSRMQITDAGVKQLSRLTELRELYVGSLPISEGALTLPHLRSIGRSGRAAEATSKNPYEVPGPLDAEGWGKEVDGFQVRLRAPETAVRVGKIPRLQVDIANRGSRQLQCMANGWCWQLEVDGRDFVMDGGGALLDVVPGRPWRNLPLVLNVAWRTADTNELTGRFGGGGVFYSAGFQPEPLRLSPGKHVIRLTVLGLPKYAGSSGPVRAVSTPVEIEIEGQNSPAR